MSDDRLRTHPEQRFASPALRYDLDAEARALRDRSSSSTSPAHRQETLYKGSDISSGPTTIALFEFDSGAALPAHRAAGVVTIHVLSGRLRVHADGVAHDLGPSQILVLAPNVEHDVTAIESTRMLLTVCLESSSGRG